MNGCGSRLGGQAQMLGGLSGYVEKGPTVSSADDAVKALQKRADELKANLAKVESWTAELAKVERMLAAAEPR